MEARLMRTDCLYRDSSGRIIVRHFTNNYVIVSLPGDMDMQSKWGIPLTEEVTPVAATAQEDEQCPNCWKFLERIPDYHRRNHLSHWIKDNTHHCPCGWVGSINQKSPA